MGSKAGCRFQEVPLLQIETIHHVSLPVTDLARAKAFYRGVLGLEEIPRPAFDFPGAWYALGDRHLHLIVGEQSTLRDGKAIDSHDIHFAIRVRSYRGALEHFKSLGYDAGATDPARRLRENPTGKAGFPQIYVLDPDRNVVEINAERLD
jgi:glyoxylase I family protein